MYDYPAHVIVSHHTSPRFCAITAPSVLLFQDSKVDRVGAEIH